MFSQLSFASANLYLMVSILEKSGYNSKKIRKKIELAHAMINMVRRDNRMLGVTNPDSPPENYLSLRLKGSTTTHGREPN